MADGRSDYPIPMWLLYIVFYALVSWEKRRVSSIWILNIKLLLSSQAYWTDANSSTRVYSTALIRIYCNLHLSCTRRRTDGRSTNRLWCHCGWDRWVMHPFISWGGGAWMWKYLLVVSTDKPMKLSNLHPCVREFDEALFLGLFVPLKIPVIVRVTWSVVSELEVLEVVPY